MNKFTTAVACTAIACFLWSFSISLNSIAKSEAKTYKLLAKLSQEEMGENND